MIEEINVINIVDIKFVALLNNKFEFFFQMLVSRCIVQMMQLVSSMTTLHTIVLVKEIGAAHIVTVTKSTNIFLKLF